MVGRAGQGRGAGGRMNTKRLRGLGGDRNVLYHNSGGTVGLLTRLFVRAHRIVCFKLVNIIVCKLYSNKASFFKRRKNCEWNQGKRAEAMGTELRAGSCEGWVWPCLAGRGVAPLGS